MKICLLTLDKYMQNLYAHDKRDLISENNDNVFKNTVIMSKLSRKQLYIKMWKIFNNILWYSRII